PIDRDGIVHERRFEPKARAFRNAAAARVALIAADFDAPRRESRESELADGPDRFGDEPLPLARAPAPVPDLELWNGPVPRMNARTSNQSPRILAEDLQPKVLAHQHLRMRLPHMRLRILDRWQRLRPWHPMRQILERLSDRLIDRNAGPRPRPTNDQPLGF